VSPPYNADYNMIQVYGVTSHKIIYYRIEPGEPVPHKPDYIRSKVEKPAPLYSGFSRIPS